jgi:Tfp pilus assembly protein PilE
MSKKIYIEIVLIISVLAGILSAVAYPQYIMPQETQQVESHSIEKNEALECEFCHKDPQNITSHIKGGNLCLYCHGGKVHDSHRVTETENIDCITCHGFPPIIPSVKQTEEPGNNIVCNNCHAPPPDSFKSSNGNLIVIHQSRGTYCINCHGTEIGSDHKEIMKNQSVVEN